MANPYPVPSQVMAAVQHQPSEETFNN